MKIRYLGSALSDIAWMRHYYRSVFPQGEKTARKRFKAAEKLIVDNPYIGERFGDAREVPISRTPFSIIYRIRAGTIEVLRVWDQRRDRGKLDL